MPHETATCDSATMPAIARCEPRNPDMETNETTNSNTLRPVVLQGQTGDLIGFYHPPAHRNGGSLGDVLLVPAFAEEMNRCRSMVTMQAHAFAAMGMGTLVLDPRGTGDSAGEFEAADWDGWRDDLQLGLQWLRQHGNGCRTVWGLRLGALMAAEIAVADSGIEQLLFWMPVTSGKPYWTQFLRIRIAAEMGMEDGAKSTTTLRERSAAGNCVEASGYLVGPLLAQRLDKLEMPAAQRLAGKNIAWFEVGVNADSAMPRANVSMVQDWQSQGVQVTQTQVVGPAFWQVHERAVAPSLVSATVAAVSAWPQTASQRAGVPEIVAQAERPNTIAAEYPVTFSCADALLAGMVHRGKDRGRLGVVIVVAGGPQFRVGAHRQFVSLARLFASNGYPVLRFDLRGMGDSGGDYLGYERSGPDIRAAIDELQRREPDVQDVALFGECESASGILFYAATDARVRKIALANPWVRTPGVQAETILKHYYLDRLKSPEFWRNVRSGQYKIGHSLSSFFQVLLAFFRGRSATRAASSGQDSFDQLPLPNRTAEGMRRFDGSVLLLMSGRDLIAREFDEVTNASQAWRGLLSGQRVTRKDIADADHTFSKPAAKAEAQSTLLNWLAI